jgi:hypothetical protein
MKKLILAIATLAFIAFPATAKEAPCRDAKGHFAKCPPKTDPAPATNGATAKCKDGTLSYSAHHSGTCSHHGGVAQWYK